MFRRKKSPRKDSLYLAFYSNDNRLEYEYIPNDASRLRRWLEKRRRDVYLKLGIEEHYGNYRHILLGDSIKIEDIAFIIHVLEQHNGIPEYRRESWLYTKLSYLYRNEIEIFIKPYIEYEKKGSAITHPYGRAYYKRWMIRQNPELKRMYHGINSVESSEIKDAFLEKINRRIKRVGDKQRYYDNKLKNGSAKEKNK
jgi:hypothetical protein